MQTFLYNKCQHLEEMYKRNEHNKSILAWVNHLKGLCDKAMEDILRGVAAYAELTQSSPIIYLLLANRTKDGFVMADFFHHKDGSAKTWNESEQSFPLFQMARLMQVVVKIINTTFIEKKEISTIFTHLYNL